MIQSVKINDVEFVLHPSGALFWKDDDLLLISDVHLGKISHFRKYGSAVPQAAITENFRRLEATVAYFTPGKICFLGDLFHSYANLEWEMFEDWVRKQTALVSLVVGNHDVISPFKYEALGVQTFSEIIINKFLLTHHPDERKGLFNICGHLHPGFKLRGIGRQSLPLRCFYKKQHQLILPAFGEFTGNCWVSPKEGDQIFAITKKEVFLVG